MTIDKRVPADFKYGPEPALFFLRSMNVLFAFSVFFWNVTEIKTFKVRENQKLESASFLFSVFPCAGETDGKRTEEHPRGLEKQSKTISLSWILYQVTPPNTHKQNQSTPPKKPKVFLVELLCIRVNVVTVLDFIVCNTFNLISWFLTNNIYSDCIFYGCANI